jgi:phosphohistidine phosphatase
MRLYFLRHGIAAAREEWAGDEVLRPLTNRGKDRVDHVAAFLVRLQVAIDLIVTSPLARAVHTAALAAPRFDLADRLVVDDRLAPGFGTAALAAVMRSHADVSALMLVGHEPDFSETIGRLIGGGRVVCKKGGVACVNVPDPVALEGNLEWLLPPGLVPA